MSYKKEINIPQIDHRTQREFQLDNMELLDLRSELFSLAESLWFSAKPDNQEQTAIDIRLGTYHFNNIATREWKKFTALTAAYKSEGDIESFGLEFMTPQIYDATSVKLSQNQTWEIMPYRSDEKTFITHDELLFLLDAKLGKDHPLVLEIARQMPQMTHKEFPAQLITQLQLLAEKRTDLRTYTARDHRIAPTIYVANLDREAPPYAAKTSAEITRVEGVEAVDYILRTSFTSLPVATGYHDINNEMEVADVSHTYELSFSIPYDTDMASMPHTTFTVAGKPGFNYRKIKQFAESDTPELKANEHFMRAMKMISDKKRDTAFTAEAS